MPDLIKGLYLAACILFILSIRSLAAPKTARLGNILGMVAMLLALTGTFLEIELFDYGRVLTIIAIGGIVGVWSGVKVKITALPQMIAVFNGLGGLAAVCVAWAEAVALSEEYFDNSVSLVVGGIAFAGSIVAFLKLQGIMSGRPLRFVLQYTLNWLVFVLMIMCGVWYVIDANMSVFMLLSVLVMVWGVLVVLPVGGADMPVVISILNACSGWACAGIGLSLDNVVLIVAGAIVGAGGAILAHVMMKAMKRNLWQVLTGSFSNATEKSGHENSLAKSGNPQDAAFIMENATKVIIVPGYGMAVAQAQHALKNMSDLLQDKYGVEVKYAIHPVAGRMPGHMNVLLAEANVDYEDVFEMNDINNDFSGADVAYVIGANDITNPSAKSNPNSPLYGMPVLDVEKAKTVFFVKRSLGTGYSGVENPLFYAPNTIMLYGDAKVVTEEIVKSLEEN